MNELCYRCNDIYASWNFAQRPSAQHDRVYYQVYISIIYVRIFYGSKRYCDGLWALSACKWVSVVDLGNFNEVCWENSLTTVYFSRPPVINTVALLRDDYYISFLERQIPTLDSIEVVQSNSTSHAFKRR